MVGAIERIMATLPYVAVGVELDAINTSPGTSHVCMNIIPNVVTLHYSLLYDYSGRCPAQHEYEQWYIHTIGWRCRKHSKAVCLAF